MELSAEQQVEYDELYKTLVAQGGPTVGKLKAAGHKDPDGVARLVEFGWVNPEADVPVAEQEPTGNPEGHDYGNTGETELEAATKEAEEAQVAADEAIKLAEEKAADVIDKTPPPCSRCNGDGMWHSPKTGYRAKTSTEPLIDTARACPECSE
jgi:hypothetical protein